MSPVANCTGPPHYVQEISLKKKRLPREHPNRKWGSVAPMVNYSEKIAKEICVLIRAGKTIKQICGKDGMPASNTVYTWLDTYPAFLAMYSRVREESAHVAADQVVEIAEDVLKGRTPPDAGRVAIAALQWTAGKRKPKVYSDKLQHIGDDENPLRHVVDVNMKPSEAYKRAIRPS